MRALVLDGQPKLRHDYPDPRPGPGESLVRVRMAGICGTDLELVRGYMSYRGVPGHEFVGEVADSVDDNLVGRRVAGEINAGCGHCAACTGGLERHCPNRTVLGILGRDGAFAEYLTLPSRNLVSIADSIPDELAVFIEPFAAAYEIFEQTTLAVGDRILVLGDGRLGAAVAMVLWAESHDLVVGGRHEEKLELLAALGIKVQLEAKLSRGYDVVIDCTGRAEGFNRALELLRPRGRLVLKSTAAAGASMNLARLVIDEITVIGSRCGCFGAAVDAIQSGIVDPRPLISGLYPLDDALAALQAAADPMNFKILLTNS